jgi:DNA-binding transcriptional LysR family regulator
MANLKAQVIDAGQGILPELRIGLVDSFSITCGTEFISALLGKSTQLTVRTGNSPFLGEILMRREIDLAVCSDAMIDADQVIRRRIFTEKYFVITPKDLQINAESPDDFRKLAKMLPIIRFYRSSQTGLQIDKFLRSIEVISPKWLDIDSSKMVTELVASGHGWAITTPMCLLHATNSAKNLRLHYKTPLGISRSLYLIARKDEYNSYYEVAYAATSNVVKTVFLPGINSIHSGLKQLVVFDDEASTL